MDREDRKLTIIMGGYMDPFLKHFDSVLEELLKNNNLEENLSKLIRLLEQEIKFQSMGIVLKVPRSQTYQLKISRNISHHYAKTVSFTDNDSVINDLKNMSILRFHDIEEFKMEKNFSQLILIPLHNNSLLKGFIFIDKIDGEFNSDDILKISSVAKIISLGVDLDRLREEIAHANKIDDITGFYTYRAFYERCEAQFALMKRYNRPMSLAIIRIDNIEKIIQTRGSENCDSLIRVISGKIRNNIRESDVLGILYKDFFGILMPETDINKNLIAVKRMDEIINRMPQMENINIGWGLIELKDSVLDVDDFIAKARESAIESCRKSLYKYTIYQD